MNGPQPRRQHIKFSEDWDKLREPRFTTIRTYRADKAEYYRGLVGRTFDVVRTSDARFPVRVGCATLVSVRRVKPALLPAGDLVRDVTQNGAVNVAWLNRVLGYPDALLLTFDNHTGLMAERKP